MVYVLGQVKDCRVPILNAGSYEAATALFLESSATLT